MLVSFSLIKLNRANNLAETGVGSYIIQIV